MKHSLCGENVHRFPQRYASESRFKARSVSPKQKTDHEGRGSVRGVLTKKMPQFKIQSFIKSFNVSLMFSTFSFVNPEKK